MNALLFMVQNKGLLTVFRMKFTFKLAVGLF